ncbi:MAG: uroporphyrinogen-III synthase, partial [Flavobacteriales bacterium]|nr:uroporphyrinogen-III synthase [Flavobacteriales bacterium]
AEFTFQSCIKLSLIPGIELLPETDWVFFSSPSGVRLFFDAFSLSAKSKIAVLGRGTATALRGTGRIPDFVPETTDVQAAVEAFANLPKGNETVLYPRSSESLLRLRTAIPAESLVDFPFYLTLPDPPDAPSDADYLVFTSPSNAGAYLGMHELQRGQKAVAIGRSTATRISEEGLTDFLVSTAPTPEGVWRCIAQDARIT